MKDVASETITSTIILVVVIVATLVRYQISRICCLTFFLLLSRDHFLRHF